MASTASWNTVLLFDVQDTQGDGDQFLDIAIYEALTLSFSISIATLILDWITGLIDYYGIGI